MKKLLLSLVVMMLLGGICFATGTSEPKEITVKFLRHSGYDADFMIAAAEEFTAKTGIKMQVDTVVYSQLHDKQVVELGSGVGTYDLIGLTEYWVAEYSRAGWLKPLNEYIEDPKVYDKAFNIDDIPESLRELNSVDGDLLALPWKFNITLLFYRGDLIQTPPKTWDELLSLAKKYTTGDRYGIALALSKPTFPTMFWDALYSAGGKILSDDSKTAAFNSPEGLEAADFLMSLIPYSAPGAISRHWDESAALLTQNKAAMDYQMPYMVNVVNDPEKSEVVGKIKYAAIPGKKYSSAGVTTWALAVPANAPHPKEAYLYIQYLLSPDKLKEMVVALEGGIVPSRTSVLQNPDFKEYPIFLAAAEGVKHAYSRPKLAEMPTIEDILATYGHRVINGEMGAKEALDRAAADVNKLLSK